MNAFFESIANFFADDEPKVQPQPKKVKLSWEQRKKAADKAINEALLKEHGGVHAATKITIAAKLRKQVADSYTKHSEAMFDMAERSIFRFERFGD